MFRNAGYFILGLISIIAIICLASCSGGGGTGPAPGDTLGYQYNAVTVTTDGTPLIGNVLYRLYCSETQAFYGPGLSVMDGPPTSYEFRSAYSYSPTGDWKDVPFPHDGPWYCGMTAHAANGDESALSAVVLGVRKQGDTYFRM
jgi:hypothetical protein